MIPERGIHKGKISADIGAENCAIYLIIKSKFYIKTFDVCADFTSVNPT
jgi:hypothetical protein